MNLRRSTIAAAFAVLLLYGGLIVLGEGAHKFRYTPRSNP